MLGAGAEQQRPVDVEEQEAQHAASMPEPVVAGEAAG